MRVKFNSLAVLIIELILTICVCAVVFITTTNAISDKANQYITDISSDFQNLEDRYVSVFKAMTIHIKEKIQENPSFEEMNAWLQEHDHLFSDAVGSEVFDGFAMTYKGGYAHSWNYGDYSAYDPNTRPWYQEAQKANGSVTVVAPYVTFLGSTLDPEVNPDQYIEMTVAQKISDSISFDLDIKTKDITALFAKNKFQYKDTTAFFFDKKGFIISTTDDTLFCHNINTPDNVINEKFSKQLISLSKNLNTLQIMSNDGLVKIVYAGQDSYQNTYCLFIPLGTVFKYNFLPIGLIMMLLIGLEILIYIRSNQTLAEVKAKDKHDFQETALSIAHHYIAVLIGNVKTQTVFAIKVSSYYKIFEDKKANIREIQKQYAEKYIKQEFIQGFLDTLSFDSVSEKLNQSEEFSFTANLKNNHWYTFRVIRSEQYQESGIFILFVENSDEQMNHQAELQSALENAKEATKAKSEFLSRMSHDIRTPMNGIIGMTHIAREQDNPPKTNECLEKIVTSSQFLLGLVNDILDMSKAESNKIELQMEPYELKKFYSYIDAVIKPLCVEKNQSFVVTVNTIPGYTIKTDMLRLNQIFFNLLSNAVKYTPEGGSIALRIKNEMVDPEHISMHAEVQDNGIGMSKQFQSVLFEPFTQEGRSDISEQRGSGLGLAIVKRMITLMGGTISVESELGKGSTFFFTLLFTAFPITKEKEELVTNEKPLTYESLAGKHVLLCEDHPLNQEIAKALLQEKQMIVELADNGQNGVSLFSQSPIGFYDIILMDIRMPVLDGYQATKLIRALPRRDAQKVPIIAMTADAFYDDVQKCLAVGMNSHISKPIETDKLFSLLISLLK